MEPTKMIYTSPRGKELVFNEWDDANYEYTVELCRHCHNKYKGLLKRFMHWKDATGYSCAICGDAHGWAEWMVDIDKKYVRFE